MEKLNVAERRTYVAPELSIAEFAIENGFGNSVASFEEETPMNNPSTFRIIMKRFLACFGCAAVLAASVSCTKDTTVAPEVKQGAMKSPLR